MQESVSIVVRRCTESDAEVACNIMRRSIEDLCILDHHNDKETLGAWLSNKTAENLRPYLAADDSFAVVASRDGRIQGFGLIGRSGEISLCYVAPDAVRHGVGSAVLRSLEKQAAAWGITQVFLTSTRTARPFYEHHGYVASGQAVTSMGVQLAQPMIKRVAPTVPGSSDG